MLLGCVRPSVVKQVGDCLIWHARLKEARRECGARDLVGQPRNASCFERPLEVMGHPGT